MGCKERAQSPSRASAARRMLHLALRENPVPQPFRLRVGRGRVHELPAGHHIWQHGHTLIVRPRPSRAVDGSKRGKVTAGTQVKNTPLLLINQVARHVGKDAHKAAGDVDLPDGCSVEVCALSSRKQTWTANQ